MDFDEIEGFLDHFLFRRRLRQSTTKDIPRYLGACHEVLARVGTFVVCCTYCHERRNWREVHVRDQPAGWYQSCCAVEDAANQQLRKK